MQQPRHINQIDEEASTAQRSDSPVQSINQRFLRAIDLGLNLAAFYLLILELRIWKL